MIFETHAHYDDSRFDDDIDACDVDNSCFERLVYHSEEKNDSRIMGDFYGSASCEFLWDVFWKCPGVIPESTYTGICF